MADLDSNPQALAGPRESVPMRAIWWRPRRRMPRWLSSPWFHLLLFLLTVFTTLAVGAHLELNYARGIPAFDLNLSPGFFFELLRRPAEFELGAPFSFTLLGILLAHELGHYLTCRFYHIRASYPYFLPAPTLIGTLGAFIRIQSPVVTRRQLFDVGVSGPLVGFIVAVPALAVGLGGSRLASPINLRDSILIGNPLALTLLARWLRPELPLARLALAPVGLAAWVGLFVTALNLLPLGQLDGGHILYAVFGDRHRLISRLAFLVLLVLGILSWPGWVVWALLLLVLGLRHPRLVDPAEPLDDKRKWLAVAAALVFALCFIPTPFWIR
jgi:membrane-associated protease RseP (regulator of RpoE activity)